MNIKIIVNPRAGGGKAREIGLKTEQFLCDLGIEYSLDSTYRPKGATSLTKKSIDEGFDMIMAVGGDGTVNEIVNGMIGSGSTLAIIPAGINNNFSRMLGIDPENIQGALETALGKNSRTIDVGKLNEKYFLNGISIGLSAEAQDTGEAAIPVLQEKGSYMLKLFKTLSKFKAPKLLIKMDGVDLHSKTLITKIANGKYFGNGFSIVPSADIEDGMLDVCVLNNMGRIKFLYNMPNILKGRHNRSYPMTTFRASNITIESPDPVKAVCDGETVDGPAPFRITVAEEKIIVKTK